VESVPHSYGANISLPVAMGVGGISVPMTVEGAVDTAVFGAYVAQMLEPTLKSREIVVLNNLSVHKVAGIAEAIESRGMRLEPLPSHEPPSSTRLSGVGPSSKPLKANRGQ
jgi:hypothetical protein